MRLRNEDGKFTESTKEWFGIGLLYATPGIGLIYNLYRSWKSGGSQIGRMTPILWLVVGFAAFMALFVLLMPVLFK